MKNRTTALILTFFFGAIGIHKFYLGQSTQGIFYILFCWTLIPSILAFFQFFGLLFMSEYSFNTKYNSGF
ncbi:hypothetical protein B4N84_27745 [Flavobacterium sp. IR1]|nr:hypothetical protein B4N84_27745 [Flavobacterium sp. IR1]